MNLKIKEIIDSFSVENISEERKEVLSLLTEFISSKIKSDEKINLNFICTHNSRRSHLSQIWAQTMAEYFGVKEVFCYSGGTEETSIFPKVLETLKNQGFEMEQLSANDNPVYAVKFDQNSYPVICFSKNYDSTFNPTSNFASIMTCSNAEKGCPFIPGAEKIIAIKYNDPKISDGTAEMDQIYAERSLEIAQEMFYAFSTLKI